jgi:hypothetical protein
MAPRPRFVTRRPSETGQGARPPAWWYVLPVGLLGLATLPYLGRPGPIGEEAMAGFLALEYLEGLRAGELSGAPLGPLPPVLHAYEGSTILSLYVAVLSILGPSIWGIRLVHVALGCGGLFAFQYVVGRWISPRVGLLGAVLLCLNPSFTCAIRFGEFVDSTVQVALFWIGLALVQRSLETRKRAYFLASGFVVGVAINAKIMAFAYILGSSVALLVLIGPIRQELSRKDGLTPATLIGFAACVLVGCAPFLGHHLVTRGADLEWIGGVASGGLYQDRQGPEVVENLLHRLHDFIPFLMGRIHILEETMPAVASRFAPHVFAISMCGLIALARFAVLPRSQRRVLGFLLVTAVVVFLTTAITPSDYHDIHILVLLTFPELAVAWFAHEIATRLRPRWAGLAVAGLLVAPALLHGLPTTVRMQRAIHTGQIPAAVSPAIHEVVDVLEARGITRFAALGGSIHHNVPFLTGNRVQGVGAVGVDKPRPEDDVWSRAETPSNGDHFSGDPVGDGPGLPLSFFRAEGGGCPIDAAVIIETTDGAGTARLHSAEDLAVRTDCALSFIQSIPDGWGHDMYWIYGVGASSEG